MSHAPNEQAPAATRSYGKYRGTVIDNTDPENLGRIKADVPSVAGYVASWAMPCVPYSDTGAAGFSAPPIASNVWIEFEAGDPRKPIWAGVFFAPGDLAAAD